MRSALVLMAVLTVAGCAGNPALSGDSVKNANVYCGSAATMGGTGEAMALSLDQSVIRAGGMTATCGKLTATVTIEQINPKPSTVTTPVKP